MEPRKVIKFGTNSFVVSLPKRWVERNKVRKGDVVYFDDLPTHMALRTSEATAKEVRTAVLHIDDLPLTNVRTKLTTLYINGYDTMELRGTSVEKRAEKIKEMLMNFAGVELMEETAHKIIVKDLMDIKEVSIPTVLRRIDVIIRAMMEDAGRPSHAESVNQRDREVNRLCLLMKRIIRQASERRIVADKLDATRMQLMKNQLIIGYLEAIGDCTKRIARAALTTITKKSHPEFMKILGAYKEAYTKIMKAYHTNTVELAYEIEMSSKRRLDLVEHFEKKYPKATDVSYNLKSLTSSIKHIARALLDYHVIRT